MIDPVKMILLIVGALLALMFISILFFTEGRNKEKDNGIVIFSRRRFYIRLIGSITIFLIFLFLIILYIFSGGVDTPFATPLMTLLLALSSINCIYKFSDKGIVINRNGIIPWDQVKCWRWLDYGNNILFIEHRRGSLKIEIGEKKEAISEFLANQKKQE